MTDFFGRLLQRSAGDLLRWDTRAAPTQLVRPSIPSIYSPAPDRVDPGVLEVEGIDPISRPPAARPEAPSREGPGPSWERPVAAPDRIGSTRLETTVERRGYPIRITR